MFVGAIIIRGCSARKRMIFTNEVIGSRLCKHNFRAFAEADNSICFNKGLSDGKCQISEL